MAFRCASCGHSSGKWMGFCPNCGSSDPLEEVAAVSRGTSPRSAPRPVPISDIATESTRRISTGIAEVDRVLGGGMVPGSVILVGGEPGVGKSTLLLQVGGGLQEEGESVLIASAEESADQVGLRAGRVGVAGEGIGIVSDDDVDAVIAAAEAAKPALLVVDSIQTMGVPEILSAPGSVSQVRESAARLVRFAKTTGTATVIVGHVTKEGGLAGPKMLEHMVDVVLYLEGDADRGFRVLRSLKNRFGATHMAGMFDMRSDGLVAVDDPSQAFLSEWDPGVPGTVIFPAVEGRRSVLVEIQALVVGSTLNQPRRSVRGLDPPRVAQVLAVLARHGGVKTSDRDVYVNVVGGWRLTEPGADLPVALAVVSSLKDLAVGRIAAWGELGLGGEVRPVPHEARRREESHRLGLDRVVAPSPGSGMRLRGALDGCGLG